MNNVLNYRQSFWRSNLYEFCEEVLLPNRKRFNLSQNVVAKQLGINQSEVSRIERGITKPKDIAIIEALCDIYKLTSPQKQKYLELTTGLSEISNNRNAVSDLIGNQISFIARLNRSGFPSLAIEQSKNLREWIEGNIELQHTTDNDISIRISHLMLEESAAWWDITIPEKTINKTGNLINQMENIATISPIYNLSNVYLSINKGFHSYILEDYINAKFYFESVINVKILNTSSWKYEVLRAYCITLGKLGDFNSLTKVEDYIYKIIKDDSLEETSKSYLLEGLGRAYTNFNTEKSRKYFELAFNYMKETESQPNFLKIRHVQLIRSYLNLLTKISTSHRKLVEVATPALLEAEQSGFTRHKLQILNLLKNK